MQKFTVGLAALVILATVVLFREAVVSQSNVVGDTELSKDVRLQVNEKNPWSNLNFNNQRRDFQFAIVTDRTGGHRPGVFGEAVKKINLMQPEFVVSVGDLIEGGNEDRGMWALEWAEFQGKIAQLQMPFFYVPGNHDISNPAMSEEWKRKFGRSYYDFRYHDVLFLALNTEDVTKVGTGRFTPEQQQWVADVLAKNKDVRWTFVFFHKPFWTYSGVNFDEVGWTPIEKSLNDRKYTVFAGHKHNYAHSVRNGHDYIMLATTGGSSKMRGVADGEFDQIVWVTMKDSGPVIANVMLDGIADKYIRTQDQADKAEKKAAAEKKEKEAKQKVKTK